MDEYLIAGRQVVTAATMLLSVMVLLGLVLWWPGRGRLKDRGLVPRMGRGRKRANLDLHSVVGFYASVYLLLICATGVFMGLPILRSVAERLFTAGKPPVEEMRSETDARTAAATASAVPEETGAGRLQVDEILARADREMPGALFTNLSLPRDARAPARVIKRMPDAPWPDATDILFFDGETADLLRIQRHEDLPASGRLNRLVFPIHAGSVFGWPTRILAALVSLVAATLPITGAIIWYPRWRARRELRG